MTQLAQRAFGRQWHGCDPFQHEFSVVYK
jgi:hypothetical protein